MILVAGGTGLLGRQVVARLVARNVPVRVLTRDATHARLALGSLADRVEIVTGDVRDRASLASAVRGVHTVVAAVQGFGGRDAGGLAAVDRDGNLNLVRVSAAAGVSHFLLMRKPLDGSRPLIFSEYTAARRSWHLWGLLGGLIWCTGALFNFVSSRAHAVGPAVSYSIGQGATMISAAWGVFVWKEFAGAPQRSKRFLTWMFIFFLAGLCAVALAPVLWK